MDSLHYALLAIIVLLVLYCARTWGSIVEGKQEQEHHVDLAPDGDCRYGNTPGMGCLTQQQADSGDYGNFDGVDLPN